MAPPSSRAGAAGAVGGQAEGAERNSTGWSTDFLSGLRSLPACILSLCSFLFIFVQNGSCFRFIWDFCPGVV